MRKIKKGYKYFTILFITFITITSMFFLVSCNRVKQENFSQLNTKWEETPNRSADDVIRTTIKAKMGDTDIFSIPIELKTKREYEDNKSKLSIQLKFLDTNNFRTNGIGTLLTLAKQDSTTVSVPVKEGDKFVRKNLTIRLSNNFDISDFKGFQINVVIESNGRTSGKNPTAFTVSNVNFINDAGKNTLERSGQNIYIVEDEIEKTLYEYLNERKDDLMNSNNVKEKRIKELGLNSIDEYFYGISGYDISKINDDKNLKYTVVQSKEAGITKSSINVISSDSYIYMKNVINLMSSVSNSQGLATSIIKKLFDDLGFANFSNLRDKLEKEMLWASLQLDINTLGSGNNTKIISLKTKQDGSYLKINGDSMLNIIKKHINEDKNTEESVKADRIKTVNKLLEGKTAQIIVDIETSSNYIYDSVN